MGFSINPTCSMSGFARRIDRLTLGWSRRGVGCVTNAVILPPGLNTKKGIFVDRGVESANVVFIIDAYRRFGID